MMVSEPCLTPFRFGDGLEVISTEKTIIPGRIGKTDVRIEANIVEKELPLLLSKASLKRAGAVLDFTNDTMRFRYSVEIVLICLKLNQITIAFLFVIKDT